MTRSVYIADYPVSELIVAPLGHGDQVVDI